MTPFDPVALVAMLLTFYPVVSAANFAKARAEQPSYFAGGVIFGSKGDKLRLPDGREFDCIVAAGGPPAGRRWQCALITPGDGPGDDPFALEPGPLEPVDEAVVIFPGGDPTFESIVADGLATLDGSEARLDGAAETMIAFDGAAQLDGTYRDLVEPAAAAHDAIRAALDNDDPADVIDATNAGDAEIDAGRGDYVEPPPPDIPEPDPGAPPGDDKEPPGKEPPP